ncbi:GNAT family N-acetyltransferase [Polymorphospora rubra]|uniref:N-acetyltransferase domain-containing protein n=1 Tax=Polymorphospora rubra TaxID=338584 RepID=A0A810N7E8_9ACTN|nr:GNAT family N-acetyltransferase [Polymorphospora rubra]BCJ67708.1 hypothetical protein Prubr_47290 [Polymorphospora rubra]
MPAHRRHDAAAAPPGLLRAWVAELPPGTIAGHVAVQRAPGSAGLHAELSRLFVTPAARRHSIATALIRQARSWAAEHGHRLTLSVTDDQRSAAVALYEATGWRLSHTTDADWTAPDGGGAAAPLRARRPGRLTRS